MIWAIRFGTLTVIVNQVTHFVSERRDPGILYLRIELTSGKTLHLEDAKGERFDALNKLMDGIVS